MAPSHWGNTMIKRIVGIALTVAALGLGGSSFAFSKGGSSGSHGGGNSGGSSGGHGASGIGKDAKSSHPSDSKTSKGAKASHAAKTPSQQLADNQKLSAKLVSLLPADTDLQAASAGFKNLGQFVAAVHVSKNLGIPFADLKAKMMDGDSLGAASKALRPTADAEVEARKARKQAAQDIATSK
jgi:hypothetical protein